MITRTELDNTLRELFQPEAFADYCPNGLQVQGKAQITRLVCGVTASRALIEAAIAWEADALFVHHGYFWKGESPCVTGMKYERLRLLIEHGISLFAYHLPLDAHPELGNNAQLAQRMGWLMEGGLEPGNPRSVGNVGRLAQPVPPDVLSQQLAEQLGREPLHISGGTAPVERIAWCTGGAQSYIEKAVALGADAFVTGEASEQTTHIAREAGIHFYAAGHHATERYGAMATGEYLARTLGITQRFIDIDNPV